MTSMGSSPGSLRPGNSSVGGDGTTCSFPTKSGQDETSIGGDAPDTADTVGLPRQEPTISGPVFGGDPNAA